jgi:hypothetical protein
MKTKVKGWLNGSCSGFPHANLLIQYGAPLAFELTPFLIHPPSTLALVVMNQLTNLGGSTL